MYLQHIPTNRRINLKSILNRNLVYYFFIFCGIFYFYWFLLSDDRLTYSFVNSDQLTIPEIARNILLKNGPSWRGERFSTAPYFFPDLSIFLLLSFFTKSTIVSIFIYGYLQLISFLSIGAWIISRISQCSLVSSLVSISLLTCVYMALFKHINLDLFVWSYVFLVSVATHFGAYLVGLLNVAVIVRFFESPRYSRFVLIHFLIICFTTLSNNLYLVYFAVPTTFLLSWYLYKGALPKKKVMLAILGAVGGAALAVYLQKYLYRGELYTEGQGLIDLRRLIQELKNQFQTHFVTSFSIFVLQPGFVCLWIWKYYTQRRRLDQQNALSSEVFIIFSLVLGMVGALCFELFFGVFKAFHSFRYLVPFYFTPLIFIASSVNKVLSKLWEEMVPKHVLYRRIIILALLVSAVLFPPILIGDSPRPGLFQWKTQFSDCFPEVREHYGLKAGIAGYWEARNFSASMDWKVKLAPIPPGGPEAGFFYWSNNAFPLMEESGTGNGFVPYNFILVSGPEAEVIHNRYGEPDERIQCGTMKLWIYRKEGHLFSRLFAEDTFAFNRMLQQLGKARYPASVFHGRVGRVDGVQRVAEEGRDAAGVMMTGLGHLPLKGKYRIEFDYESTESLNSNALVRIEFIGKNKEKVEKEMPLSHNSIYVELERRSNLNLQVFYEGLGKLRISSVTIEKE